MNGLERLTLGVLGLLIGTIVGGWQLFTGTEPSDYWIGIGAVVLAVISAIAIGKEEGPR